MLNNELIAFLFDGKSSSLSNSMTQWLVTSRRFAVFVDTFRDKIRKKIRVTHATESLLDLQLELETAYLLLREKSFSLTYEPDHAKRVVRAPDFAVTYTTSVTFMLEVTRIRGDLLEKALQSNTPTTLSPLAIRVADTICNKLGQLQPKRPNILLIGMDTLGINENDLRAAMLHIQARVQREDSDFLRRHGFRDRAEFFQHYLRLSEILIRGSNGESPLIWVNPQAKIPLPSKVRTALYRSHTLSSDSS
jgi:hypothetical protein